MLPNKLFCVGFLLLTVAYTAKSSVMITANKQDLMDLTKKFISESLTDKIAEFIVKSTGDLMRNVSGDGHKESSQPINETTVNDIISNKDLQNQDTNQKLLRKNQDSTKDKNDQSLTKQTINKLQKTESQYWDEEKNEINDKRLLLNNLKNNLSKYLKAHDKKALHRLEKIKFNPKFPTKAENRYQRKEFKKYHPGTQTTERNIRESEAHTEQTENTELKPVMAVAPFLRNKKEKTENLHVEGKSQFDKRHQTYPMTGNSANDDDTSSESDSEVHNKLEHEKKVSTSMPINQQDTPIKDEYKMEPIKNAYFSKSLLQTKRAAKVPKIAVGDYDKKFWDEK